MGAYVPESKQTESARADWQVVYKALTNHNRDGSALMSNDSLKWFCSVYNHGYQSGHNDTVEGQFASVHHNNMEIYHDEEVMKILEDLHKRQFHAACPTVAQVPDGFVIMPKELTADNGAKYVFVGEFSEVITLPCPDCGGGEYQELETDRCGTCQDSGDFDQEVSVSWSTIKKIYRLAVENFSTTRPQEGE